MPRRPTQSVTARRLILLAMLAAPGAAGQLRIATWNVTNYAGGRVGEFQTAIYGVYEGRSMAPDVLIGQEFISAAAVAQFADLLNTAPDSPGDWAAAPFIDGPDTDSALFYRAGRVELLGVTLVAPGGPSPNHPRHLVRYDIRPVGYEGPGATLACYSTHMKAQASGSDDDQRRLLEAQRIRADAAALPAGWHFLLGGDLNIQSSSEMAYTHLVGSWGDDAGRLFDPIATPGTWNNNVAFRFVHTQDPAGAGGMDDRHDQILLAATLVDGAGFDYIGDAAAPYSTTTWNDANHSYRSWGNDGTSFNTGLNIATNAMVGPAIARALRDSAAGGGHLPVFLDLRLPPEIDAPASIDFGRVPAGAPASAVLEVAHAGDVALWTEAGLADLRYELAATDGFAVEPGPFVASPGQANAHTVTLDAGLPGPVSGVLTIASDSPDEPVLMVMLTGEVVACAADFDGDGELGAADFAAFRTACLAGDLRADFDGDGTLGTDDFIAFRAAFLAGCG